MNAIEEQSKKLEKLLDPKEINPILFTVHQQVKRRIHAQGKAANGSQIGTYSKEYLEQRKKKGLGGNAKVILEFTGQMRNDFVPIKSKGRIIGSGFTNVANFNKAIWVEKTYKKVIYDLTPQENKLLVDLLQEKSPG